jgi:acetylglutamate kinase
LTPVTILKLGGELLEDADAMNVAASGIRTLTASGPVAVVHGGGRAIDADLKARGKSPHFVDGLRVTDADTLDTVVGVLAGRINTAFVAALNAAGVRAVGLTGADAGIGLSDVAQPLAATSGALVDLGLVGVPRKDAPLALISDLLRLGYVPVIACVGVTRDGRLLNVNADVLASHLARAMGASQLIIAGKTAGVFDASGVTCERLEAPEARQMVQAGTARDGMVAKLGACLEAIDGGAKTVRIVDGRNGDYQAGPGTTIVGSTDREYTRC